MDIIAEVIINAFPLLVRRFLGLAQKLNISVPKQQSAFIPRLELASEISRLRLIDEATTRKWLAWAEGELKIWQAALQRANDEDKPKPPLA